MRKFLLQVNKYISKIFIFAGDKRIIRADEENLCCKYIKQIGDVSIPNFGIIYLKFNFCPTCGRKLEREHAPGPSEEGEEENK